MPGFTDMLNAVTGMGGTSPSAAPSTGDFSGQLNNILAPFQNMMSRFTSPYATMGPNNWLAQQHPQLAGALDNAFLTMAQTPGPQGPEGVGGGISRTFQGLVGAQQYNRQRMLQGMMLPYEMATRQLQAQDVISQIKEREAMAPYYRSRADWYEARMGQMQQPHVQAGPPQIDDQNRSWDRIFDPTTGRIRNYNAEMGKFSDELPTDQQPSFQKFQNRNKLFGEGGGGFLGQLAVAQTGPKLANESDSDYATRVGNIYTRLGGQMAGQRVAGDQGAPHPYQDTKDFLAEEEKNAYRDIEPIEKWEEYKQKNAPFQEPGLLDATGIQKLHQQYQAYQAQYNQSLTQRDQALSAYRRSGAPARGVGLFEYMANPGPYNMTNPAPAPPPPKVGDVVNGFKYGGGDPNDQSSWTKQ